MRDLLIGTWVELIVSSGLALGGLNYSLLLCTDILLLGTHQVISFHFNVLYHSPHHLLSGHCEDVS